MENSITEWKHITNFDGKYILDEDNMIVDKGLSGDILREKIGELLKKNK